MGEMAVRVERSKEAVLMWLMLWWLMRWRLRMRRGFG
jgi:hypothetical protein